MPVREIFDELLDALLPASCAGCGRRGALVCPACGAGLRAAPAAPPPEPVAWWTACFAYEGVARELVARAKYRGQRRFLVLIARRLAGAVEPAPVRPDLITWAPASAARIRSTGVDHGEMLARAVGGITGVPVACCLVRAPGPAQTGLGAHARRSGPRLEPGHAVAGATVLVVDDVATTGGTLAAAARALGRAQARAVIAATIARTPRPGAHRPDPAYTSAPPADPLGPRSR